ncbi:MAG: hypothetical protein C5B50_03890 [Verrucomicrobia bacterium]|nr:MAG: hypothetical protein C5B50_03890 [Verrucomicrobiota bacterium]
MKRNNLTPLTAAILCGGLGTRLKSVAGDLPKVLMAVAGKPFAHYLLQQLSEAGIAKSVLCTGFGAEKVSSLLGASFQNSRGRAVRAPMRLEYSRETGPLGTGGALRLALPLLDSEWVLVLNGDSYAEVDLGNFGLWHQRNRAMASIVVCPEPQSFVAKGTANTKVVSPLPRLLEAEGLFHTSPGQRPGSPRQKTISSTESAIHRRATRVKSPVSQYGKILTNEKGEVLSFLEKPQARTADSLSTRKPLGESKTRIGTRARTKLRLVNAGIYLLSKTIIEQIPADRPVSLEREVLPGLVGKRFFCYTKCRCFLDIGTPESYASAEQFFAQKGRAS